MRFRRPVSEIATGQRFRLQTGGQSASGAPFGTVSLAGTVPVWDGQQFVDAEVRAWDGNDFVPVELRRWDGTDFV